MTDSVKAAVLVAPGKIEIQKFPYPGLAKGCAIMRMEMSGICGTDKHTFRGEVKQYAGTAEEITTPFPIIQGHENVGIIEEIDDEAKRSLEFEGKELKAGTESSCAPTSDAGIATFASTYRVIHGATACVPMAIPIPAPKRPGFLAGGPSTCLSTRM